MRSAYLSLSPAVGHAPIFCITDESRLTVMETVEMILSHCPSVLDNSAGQADVTRFSRFRIPGSLMPLPPRHLRRSQISPPWADDLVRLKRAAIWRQDQPYAVVYKDNMAAITMPRRRMLLSIKMKNMLRSSDQMVTQYAAPLKNVPVSQ